VIIQGGLCREKRREMAGKYFIVAEGEQKNRAETRPVDDEVKAETWKRS